ncbi:MAG: M56 family metallopeptidase [Planctomycetota bacterium]|jgi:beta-lactamase regulating signal transducer with metallopeptidase domain
MNEAMTNIWALFGLVVRTSLQAGVLVVLILGVQLVLRKKLSVRWSSWLWIVLLVRIALPAAPSSRFSIYNLLPGGEYSAAVNETVMSDQPVGGYELAVDEETPELTSTVSAKASSESTSGQGQTYRLGLLDVVPVAWLAGVVVLAGYIFWCHFNLWRIVRKQMPISDKPTLELLEECKERLKIKTTLAVVETDRIKTPALFGFIRPRLLLPKGMLDNLTNEQLGHIFLHELAHLKRLDIPVGYLMNFFQILHWFNLLVWLAFYRARLDRELSCDALALTVIGQENCTDYGRTIMYLLEKFTQPRRLCGTAAVLEDKSQIKRRITMIAQYKNNSYRVNVWSVVLLFVVGVVTLTNGRIAKAHEQLAGRVDAAMERNLLAYYSFDKDGGTRTADISGMDFHGKVKGASFTKDGKVNGAMVFDGKNDYIAVDDISLKRFTFAAWIKRDVSVNWKAGYEINDNFGVFDDGVADESAWWFKIDSSTGGLRGGFDTAESGLDVKILDREGRVVDTSINNRRIFTLIDNEGCYALQGNARNAVGVYVDDALEVNEYGWVLKPNEWTHIAVTHDGNVFSIYRNGVLTEKGKIKTSGVSGTLYIGGTDVRWGKFWAGAIDEVAIFNRVLKPGEIKRLYKLISGDRFTETSKRLRTIPEGAVIDEEADRLRRLKADEAAKWHNLIEQYWREFAEKYEKNLR